MSAEEETSIDLVLKILEFQQANEDEPVAGTSYSSHFIDVQLQSLLTDDFCPELFTRLLDITVDENVCKHIWKNYQELLAKVVNNLNEIGKDDDLPIFTADFLRIISRLLRAKVDLNKESDLLDYEQEMELIDSTKMGEEFKSTFQEIGILDFNKLFELVIALFSSSCPRILSACLKIIIELLHRTYINYEEILTVVEGETFMSKLHFIMTCSTNEDLQSAIGEFFKFFSYTYTDDFSYFIPLIDNVLQMREEKFSSALMDDLIFSILNVEVWPITTEFYEFLNLLATKLKEFDDLAEISSKFHERLTVHNNALMEAHLKAR